MYTYICVYINIFVFIRIYVTVTAKSLHPLLEEEKNMYMMAVVSSNDLYSSHFSVMNDTQTTSSQKTFTKLQVQRSTVQTTVKYKVHGTVVSLP